MDQTEPTLEIVNDNAVARDIHKALRVLKHQCVYTGLAYIEKAGEEYIIWDLVIGNKNPETQGTQTRLAHLRLIPSQNGHGWDFAAAAAGWES